VMRVVVDHDDPKALDLFAREAGSAGLSFAPGITGLIGGRPKAVPVVRLFSFMIDKRRLAPATVQVGVGAPFAAHVTFGGGPTPRPSPIAIVPSQVPRDEAAAPVGTPMVTVALLRVAHARSGDKGDASNIAVFCRRPEYMDHLRTVLTPERIARHFATLVLGPVTRYEAPGLHAFNFMLENALGGGGMASQRIDPQGKAYGQRALEMKVEVPAAWLDDEGTPTSRR